MRAVVDKHRGQWEQRRGLSRGGCLGKGRSNLDLRNTREFTKKWGKSRTERETTCANTWRPRREIAVWRGVSGWIQGLWGRWAWQAWVMDGPPWRVREGGSGGFLSALGSRVQ